LSGVLAGGGRQRADPGAAGVGARPPPAPHDEVADGLTVAAQSWRKDPL
jgi:hypothetical protein